MDEELLFAKRHFAQHAQGSQIMQAAGCRLALGDALVHQVANAAVRLLEDHIDQFARVDLGQLASNW